MATVSQQYIEGIKEGRKLFDWWKSEGFNIRDTLAISVEHLQRLRDETAQMYGSKYVIDFYDGELDFYRNQLKKMES